MGRESQLFGNNGEVYKMSTQIYEKFAEDCSISAIRFCGPIRENNKSGLCLQILFKNKGYSYYIDLTKKEAIDFAMQIIDGMTQFD